MAIVSAPLLEAKDISHSFGPKRTWWRRTEPHRVLQNVSLRVDAARTIGVVGESGSGKSTLCRLLLKLETPTTGDVLFCGQMLDALDARQRREFRRSVQAIFQDPLSSLNPRMTVAAVLQEPFQAAGLHTASAARRQRVEELLQLVSLPVSLAGRYPAQLSGGQRQRVAIARALALEPRLIIADEPVTALDVSVQAQIMNLLRDLQEQRGVSYVMVSHDLNMVRFLCHDVVVMQQGRIVERGPSASVFERPQHPYTQALFRATPVPDPDAPRPSYEMQATPSMPSDEDREVEVFPGHHILEWREGSNREA